MKLYSLSVLYKGEAKVVLLKAAYDVSSFSFFQRASVQEFMTFTSQLIVERSAKGSRASVKEQEYLCHVYVRNDSLAGVVIADSEYPSRVAFTLLEKVLDEFSKQVDRIEWPVGSPATIQYTALDGHLSRYQNPREADPMTKVQAELDETKIILVSRRGERGQCCGLGPAACACRRGPWGRAAPWSRAWGPACRRKLPGGFPHGSAGRALSGVALGRKVAVEVLRRRCVLRSCGAAGCCLSMFPAQALPSLCGWLRGCERPGPRHPATLPHPARRAAEAVGLLLQLEENLGCDVRVSILRT
ncbi:synaptobrevin homolog YKT6 isoform X5 [Oryctolagus cuniculus]|uniref:synaptobrevin homolog YKT6 isoform X5 n=1 Tax=Oryctolagus cuniculus TaxID=9986 RepID=UPI003879BE9A